MVMATHPDLNQLRPLLMSYGGGHAQIMAAVAEALIARGCRPSLIGLTTAAHLFKLRGLPVQSVLALQESVRESDSQITALVAEATRDQVHPDILPEETTAYFAIGITDLVQRLGADAAREQLRVNGRKAFMPVAPMVRYLERTRPDVVVTTTSPRFEHAMLQAARQLGIPSLAISDLFLLREREWIVPGPFAEHLTVFAPMVRSDLLAAGLVGTEIHVTGNPAFDTLRDRPGDASRRATLRKQLGVQDKTVILWPAAQLGARGRSGDLYAGPQDLIPVFESLCQSEPEFAYILRHHPNSAFTLGDDAPHGILDDGRTLSPEDALLVADVVCAEVSTMGLQAALKGIPVICVKYAEDAVYPLNGMGQAAADLDEMKQMLLSRNYAPPEATLSLPKLGTASDAVVDLIKRIATTA